MIISKKKGKISKVLCSSALAVMLGIAGSAMAAGTSNASISPGSYKATGNVVTATGTSGSLNVESSSSVSYVTGYAKKEISWWPDSTVQTGTAYSSSPVKNKQFSAEKGSRYFAEAYTQHNTTSIYGLAQVKVN